MRKSQRHGEAPARTEHGRGPTEGAARRQTRARPREARGRGLEGGEPRRGSDVGSIWQFIKKSINRAGAQECAEVRDGQSSNTRVSGRNRKLPLRYLIVLTTGTLCRRLRAHHERGPGPNLVLKGYFQQPLDRGTVFIPVLNGKAKTLEHWCNSPRLTH